MLTENKTKPKNQKANFYCKECGKSLTNKYDFAIHIRKSHRKEYKCKLCEKTFIDSWKFELHSKSHDDILPLKCNICDKEFYVNWRLKKHIVSHDLNQKFCHFSNNGNKNARHSIEAHFCYFCNNLSQSVSLFITIFYYL